MNRPLASALTVGALLWAALLLLAPAALAHPVWRPPATQLYRASAGICHQKTERTFHLNGRPMPVCARCAGLYAAGALGTLLGWMAFSRTEIRRSRTWLLAAAAPTVVTWGLEASGFVAFSNAARALAALPLGAVAGWLFVGMLRYDAPSDAGQIHNSRSRARSA